MKIPWEITILAQPFTPAPSPAPAWASSAPPAPCLAASAMPCRRRPSLPRSHGARLPRRSARWRSVGTLGSHKKMARSQGLPPKKKDEMDIESIEHGKCWWIIYNFGMFYFEWAIIATKWCCGPGETGHRGWLKPCLTLHFRIWSAKKADFANKRERQWFLNLQMFRRWIFVQAGHPVNLKTQHLLTHSLGMI